MPMSLTRKMLTEHFSESEFRCRCRRPECDAAPMNPDFMLKLEAVRNARGRGMLVDSGSRCKYWNEKKGGSPNSMHLLGRAADIWVGGLADRVELERLGLAAGMKGIGLGMTFIHLDDREFLTKWVYP